MVVQLSKSVPGYVGMVSMSKLSKSALWRPVLVVGSTMLLGACSSDLQRFSDYPPVNQTASTSPAASSGASVQSSRLGGTSLTANAKPSWQTGYAASGSSSAAAAPARTAYTAPSRPSASGTVQVQPGQTMYSIARANNLTVGQLASANNIPAPYTLKVGQRLTVPGTSQPTSPAATFTPVSHNVAPKNYAGTNLHRVSAGETLFAVGRKYNVHPYKIAEHNGLAKPYSLSVGQQLRIPGSDGFRSAAATSSSTGSTLTKQSAYSGSTVTKDQSKVAAAQPVQQVQKTTMQNRTSIVGTNDTGAGFRWPVRGRLISRYGSKPNGTRNEGINIAVPEGTDIRASEAGVVAYSGNELKGYGNLILVRHPDGWVTAYAHAKEAFVQRGDTVRRGQVIAKAGSTGSVNSPQLHFELRKGASAVDPEKYLSSATASN